MRKNKKLIYWIFGLLSLLSIALAVILRKVFCVELGADIAKDVGVVLGSICLLDALWGVMGGEPLSQEIETLKSLNTLSRDATYSGLARILPRASDLAMPEMHELIKNSKHNIDISGYTLHTLIENAFLLAAIKDRINSGVEVRLLQCSVDNPSFDFVVENRATMVGLMKDALAAFVKLRGELDERQRSKLRIAQLKDSALFVAIRRFDEEMAVLHYLHSQNTPGTPVYIVKGVDKPLFELYQGEFDAMFQKAQAI